MSEVLIDWFTTSFKTYLAILLCKPSQNCPINCWLYSSLQAFNVYNMVNVYCDDAETIAWAQYCIPAGGESLGQFTLADGEIEKRVDLTISCYVLLNSALNHWLLMTNSITSIAVGIADQTITSTAKKH